MDLSHCLCCTNFEGILKAPIKIPVLMSQPSLVTLCLPTCHGFQQTMSPLMWGMSRHGPTYHMTLSLTPGLSGPMYTLLFTPLVPISPQHPRYDNITYWLRDSPCSWISTARVRSSIIFSAFQSMGSCINLLGKLGIAIRTSIPHLSLLFVPKNYCQVNLINIVFCIDW